MGYSIDELKEEALRYTNSNTAIALIKLLKPIQKQYFDKLDNKIDYDSMIIDAIELIKSHKVKLPFKTIMIDEYQDISPPRAALIKAILEQDPRITLFSVGDDWQGIYRFSGADLNLTYDYEDYFRRGTTVSLGQTYRFNSSISKVAAKFVTQNPKQLKKNIDAETAFSSRVHVVKTTTGEQQEQIMKVLSWLSVNAAKGSILLLNRYRYKVPKFLHQLKQYAAQLGFNLKFDSIHSSKGKEADYVILMDINNGKNGFPSEKITHPLVDILLPQKEQFDFAEERRLLYVALTRAKEHVFLVSIAEGTSSFIKELSTYDEDISFATISNSPLTANIYSEPCPACETGDLIKRNGRFGSFTACTNYPLCEYSAKNCSKCDSPRRVEQNFFVCIKDSCGWKDVRCEDCGSMMVKREGSYGYFYGCTTYPDCRNTKRLSEVSF